MPKNKRPSGYRKKKRRSRKRRRNSQVLRYSGLSYLPQEFHTKHTWRDSYYLNEAAGGGASNSGLTASEYGINNLFDLNGAGGQPMGFDEMANLYKRYLVTSCVVTITTINMDTVPLQQISFPFSSNETWGIDAATFPYERYAEQPGAKVRQMSYLGSNNVTKTVHRINMRKLTGTGQKDDLGWSGTYLAAPVNLITFMLYHRNPTDDDGTLKNNVDIKIDFRVKWFFRQQWQISTPLVP